jgi:hypothetical protein
MIKTAAARKLFARAARRRIEVDADALADAAEGDLVRRWRDLLGLARRAGRVVTDGPGIAAWLASGRAGLVIETGVGGGPVPPGVARVALAERDDLGRAVGCPDCGRAAVAAGIFAGRLVNEAGRLAGFGRATVIE